MSQVLGSPTPGKRAIFYGWYLMAVAWLLYGLQVAGFYSWGFYLPEMTRDLGLSRAGGGVVFGVPPSAPARRRRWSGWRSHDLACAPS